MLKPYPTTDMTLFAIEFGSEAGMDPNIAIGIPLLSSNNTN
jgi:hypothetical protein